MGARLRSWWQKIRSGLRPWWQKIKQHPFITTGIIVVLIAVAFAVLVHIFGWDWTGFNGGYSQITTTSTSHGTTTATQKPSGKTLWDLLQLLIIPVVLAIGGFWLNRIQKAREEKTTKERAKDEQKIATDNQRETALQDYLNKMSDLLLNAHLGELTPDGKPKQEYEHVHQIARVRTLTALRWLDGKRKGSVLQFLSEAGLINGDNRIIDLRNADLGEAFILRASLQGANLYTVWLYKADLRSGDLRGAYLEEAHLEEAFLRGANLEGAHLENAYLLRADLQVANLYRANLEEAFLQEANLYRANLEGAFLRGANLEGADLSGADLSEADLSGANLRGANLGESNLNGANLNGADLGGADLDGAKVTPEQLAQAKLLTGAIMPDWSKHP